MSIFKGKGDLVQLADSFPHGFELTGLYAECPRAFGKKLSSSFATFVQALALHDNLVAQTFFRSFWIPADQLVPPPPTEIPLKPSESDSDEEEEDSDVPKAAPKKKKPTGIIFRPVDPTPSPSSTVVNSPPPTASSSVSLWKSPLLLPLLLVSPNFF